MVLSQHKHVTEVLLSNKLDKDFQSMLLPLELANNFILLPKYYIRDDFITPKGTISNFISFFIHLNVKLQNIFNILDTNKTVLKKITLLNWVYMLSISIFYLI
ncbi:uncharacterized protein LOC131854190, partial [Achroia grisella]|uniref:uncharacterized protein LOC131854190 n=1 Tax=Achroia grisella TaxID=688607 RepID=UPI0027D221D1